MKEHMDLLGYAVVDVVSGFKGVVSTVGFDLYGCVQAIVTPPIDEKGALGNSLWFDVKRLKKTSDAPVMPVPTFETLQPVQIAGGYDKPVR
jgi:hypothetical protein